MSIETRLKAVERAAGMGGKTVIVIDRDEADLRRAIDDAGPNDLVVVVERVCLDEAGGATD